jgi:hypothetical protein
MECSPRYHAPSFFRKHLTSAQTGKKQDSYLLFVCSLLLLATTSSQLHRGWPARILLLNSRCEAHSSNRTASQFDTIPQRIGLIEIMVRAIASSLE